MPNTEAVLFDHRPAEFPVATAVPHAPRARAIALAADLRRWLAVRWQWLKPRTVPCAVAALGMVAVLAFSNYLTNLEDAPAPQTSSVATGLVRSVQVVPSYLAR